MGIAFEPLPLVIGVTGHVDLREADVPRLRNEVAAVFDRLERDYANPASRPGRMQRPEAGATPMLVLSTLAEGAGQLVTGLALARGLRVIAPLPLPVDAYRRDFEWDPDRPDVLSTFDAWMAHPDIHKLFVGYEKGNSPDDVRLFGEKRNLQFRRAGMFIARHCDVLIALWDGKADATAGSPAEIVGFKRHGIPLDVTGSARAGLDAPEIGPVIHIVTPRAMKKDTALAVSTRCWGAAPVTRERDAARKRAPETDIAAFDHDCELWRSFEASIRQSRGFNLDAGRLLASAHGRNRAGQSFQQLFEVDMARPETKAAALKAGTLAPRRGVLYAVADALAQHRQKIFRRDLCGIAGLGLFAFGCFLAVFRLTPALQAWHDASLIGRLADPALLSGGLAAMVAVVAVAAVAIRRRHQERFLDYRALAEALRVAVFWNLAGIDSATHAWPARMPRELGWAQTCLRRLELFDKMAPASPAGRPSLNAASYDWIRRMWIEGQLGYSAKQRSRCLKAARWRTRGGAAILGAVAALAVVLLLAGGLSNQGQPVRDLLSFAIGFLPGVALLAGYAGMHAFSAMARRHDRMAQVFARALAMLPAELDETNHSLVRDTVHELGVEAMREVAGWIAIRRPRAVDARGHPS